MGDNFLGELRLFSYNRIPDGWAPCNGQLLQVRQNQALFALLGTRYGGDGQNTFALPDLRGRVPIFFNNEIPLGRKGGEAGHALTTTEMPLHTHVAMANSEQSIATVAKGNIWGAHDTLLPFSKATPKAPMNEATIEPTGKGQAHPNMQPYLTLQICIAMTGIFPSPN